jgi:hypothetical protein
VPRHHPSATPPGRDCRGRSRAWAGARPALAVLALLACLLLAACGSSSSGSSAGGNAASHEAQAEAKFADFAKCLREHGINAETAAGPSGGRGLKFQGTSGPAAFEAAQKACARFKPEAKHVNLSPQEKVEHEEQVQKFAKCMREHGIKVETSSSQGAVRIRIQSHPGESGAPNPESPGFQAAQSACQKLLPFKPGQSERTGAGGAAAGPGGQAGPSLAGAG